jgi:hypothetical protein
MRSLARRFGAFIHSHLFRSKRLQGVITKPNLFARKHTGTLAVNRRNFITRRGAAIAPWPLRACAQQPPVVRFLSVAAASSFAHLVVGFRRGLKETGFVEGRNITNEYRWAEDKPNPSDTRALQA